MGLLGTDMNDPQTMGILALASGLMRGDAGGGLLGYGQAIQSAQNSQVDRADKMQQIQLRNIQLQQAQQQWEALKPIYDAIGRSQSGAGQGVVPSQGAIPPTPGGALGSGTYGIPTGGQPASAPSVGGGPGGSLFGVPMSVLAPALLGGPGKLADAAIKYNEPTEFMKTLEASGVQRGSPQWQQALAENVGKTNYIAPVNARPGSILRDPRDPSKIVAFNPHIPDGTSPRFDASGNVVEYQPIGNAEAAIGLSERAKTFGKAQATPTVAYGPDGTPRFSTGAQDVQRANGFDPTPAAGPMPMNLAYAQSTPEQRAASDVSSLTSEIARVNASKVPDSVKQGQLQILNQELAKAQGSQPAIPQSVPVTPQQRPGLVQGATLGQDELSKKWSTLNDANSQAETTKSYLQTIKQLSDKAATGPFTDKLQFTNALLSLAGGERATDATTANNLLDKYSNQIVSRLGSGPLGTDAARSILQSAYPNAKMTKDAISEAADNLIGASSMTQAKAKLLQGAATARDPQAYTQKEVTFDQNADPRLWQLSNMDAQSAQRFLSKLPSGVQADLRRKAANLRMIGAL